MVNKKTDTNYTSIDLKQIKMCLPARVVDAWADKHGRLDGVRLTLSAAAS